MADRLFRHAKTIGRMVQLEFTIEGGQPLSITIPIENAQLLAKAVSALAGQPRVNMDSAIIASAFFAVGHVFNMLHHQGLIPREQSIASLQETHAWRQIRR